MLGAVDLSIGNPEETWIVQGLFACTVDKRQQNRIVFGYQGKEAEFSNRGLTTAWPYGAPMTGSNFQF